MGIYNEAINAKYLRKNYLFGKLLYEEEHIYEVHWEDSVLKLYIT